MVKVDSKGRIVLPQAVRDHLDLAPGTEVAVHAENGKIIVEPEDEPERLIERMDRLVAETSSDRRETSPLVDSVDPIAQKHRDAVRRGASEHSDE